METNLQRYTAILDDFWSAKKKFVKTSFLLKTIRFKRFFFYSSESREPRKIKKTRKNNKSEPKKHFKFKSAKTTKNAHFERF